MYERTSGKVWPWHIKGILVHIRRGDRDKQVSCRSKISIHSFTLVDLRMVGHYDVAKAPHRSKSMGPWGDFSRIRWRIEVEISKEATNMRVESESEASLPTAPKMGMFP